SLQENWRGISQNERCTKPERSEEIRAVARNRVTMWACIGAKMLLCAQFDGPVAWLIQHAPISLGIHAQVPRGRSRIGCKKTFVNEGHFIWLRRSFLVPLRLFALALGF